MTLAFWGAGGGQLIFKHDASRIVQTLLKVGSQGVRQNIAEEMKGHYVALAKSAYARNTVLKVLLYLYVLLFNGGGWGALCFNRLCVSRPAMRKAVIREFYGHVIPMLRHKEASLVIEEIFLEYAKQNERLSLLEEFYGPEFSLFKTTENSEPKTLGEIKQSHPEKMPAILKNLQQTIQDMINKGTVRFNIAHHAIMEFMTHAPVAQVQVRPPHLFFKVQPGKLNWLGRTSWSTSRTTWPRSCTRSAARVLPCSLWPTATPRTASRSSSRSRTSWPRSPRRSTATWSCCACLTSSTTRSSSKSRSST